MCWINRIEDRKTTENMKPKFGYLKISTKLTKPLPRLKREYQIIRIRNERSNSTTNLTKIKRVIKES